MWHFFRATEVEELIYDSAYEADNSHMSDHDYTAEVLESIMNHFSHDLTVHHRVSSPIQR